MPSFIDPPIDPHRDLPHQDPSSTYLQYLDGLHGEMRDWCLRWVQVCRFARRLPARFEIFEGCFASLGIDRLGLFDDVVIEFLKPLAGSGVRLPGTKWKLRVARPWCALFEAIRGDEPTLPAHWLEGLELHGDPESVWIGRRALIQPSCPTLFANVDELSSGARRREPDRSQYERHRFGWKLRDAPSWPNFIEMNS